MADDPLDESAVAAAWDSNARQWADDVQAGFDLYRELYTFPAFLDFLPDVRDRRLIDLGCGEGANTRRMADLGAQLTGIDLSTQMIARARSEEAKEPRAIRYKVRSFAALDGFPRDSFDGAVSTMALMDGPDFAAAMRECHRILVPGGFLCFSILHPCFITPAIRWVRSQSGDYEGLQVGRYFDTEPFVEQWRFSKRPEEPDMPLFSVPRFPRTLTEYLNSLCTAGFKIERIAEPRPDPARAAQNAWLARWREHAPLVLFVCATKPPRPSPQA